MPLIISDSQVRQMLAHAQAGYPEEVCGLLLGCGLQSADRRITVVRPAININRVRARDRYELDPMAYLAAENEARENGWKIIGIYHTHPDHPAIPSETDRQRAFDLWGQSESWSYVIIEVSGGQVATWKSWVLREASFYEEKCEVVPVIMV